MACDKRAAGQKEYDAHWVEFPRDGEATYFWDRSENSTTWELPPGKDALWRALRSRSKGATYYFNKLTEENIWSLPPVDSQEAFLRQAERDEVLRIFRKWDQDGNGTIESQELASLLKELGMEESSIPDLLSVADLNKDGAIGYHEFVRWILSSAPPSLHAQIFCDLQVQITMKRSGQILSKELKVKATDPISVLASKLSLGSTERCRIFFEERELFPYSRPFAEFGVAGGESITVIVSEVAPHMLEYFKTLQQQIRNEMDTVMDNTLKILEMFQQEDKAQLRKWNKSRKQEMSKLRPLIEKCFDHHDVNRNEVLDKAESAFFFDHYVSKNDIFAETLAEMTWVRSFRLVAYMMEDHPFPIPVGKEKKFLKKIRELKKAFRGEYEQYLQKKAERDAAAFASLDVSKDGGLQKSEVIAGLMPTSTKNLEVLKALGFDVEEGAQQMLSSFDLPPEDPIELRKRLMKYAAENPTLPASIAALSN